MIGIRPLLSVLAAIAALVVARPALAGEPLTGANLAQACRDAGKNLAFSLHLSPEITRQGATLTISVVGLSRDNPWGASTPAACMTGWTVSDPAVARFSRDHRTLVIADTAPPGAKVKVTAGLGDKTAMIEFTVVARDAVVLTGYWTEVGDADCPMGEPMLREVHFRGDGRFEVTWMPFERYVDYWGTYSFDPATGAVSFSPTGGNHTPGDADLQGRAAIGADGLLRFTEFNFGSPPSGAARRPCGVFKSR